MGWLGKKEMGNAMERRRIIRRWLIGVLKIIK
jgi:hypothetical protein